MDVFGEGHSNEVYTKNMISAPLIKQFLIVYICVIRNFNQKRMLWMLCGWCLFFPLTVPPPQPPSTVGVSNYLLWHKILWQFHLVIFKRYLDGRIMFPVGGCLLIGSSGRRFLQWGNRGKTHKTSYFLPGCSWLIWSIFISHKRLVNLKSFEIHLILRNIKVLCGQSCDFVFFWSMNPTSNVCRFY